MQIIPDPRNVQSDHLELRGIRTDVGAYLPLKEECSLTKPKVCERPSFTVAGIQSRTTNQNQQSLFEIPRFWQKFYQEHIVEKIPGAVDPDVIYAVYSDYDERGYYSVLLGVQTLSSSFSQDLDWITIPSQKYAMISIKGPFSYAIAEAWEHIFSHSFPYTRAFRADFEIYTERSRRLQGAEVDLYLSIL